MVDDVWIFLPDTYQALCIHLTVLSRYLILSNGMVGEFCGREHLTEIGTTPGLIYEKVTEFNTFQ